jgi:nucleotide-binding universal stress UspA family protein
VVVTEDTRPIVVAFDGSAEAQAAVRAAATLFGDRLILVVSVWEPGLARLVLSVPDTTGVAYVPPRAEDIATVDRAEREHATWAANAGARLARELGVTAEALPVPDNVKVGETVAAIGEQRNAAALVVGSRGLGRVRSGLLGSTSRQLLHATGRPVLVVRAPE